MPYGMWCASPSPHTNVRATRVCPLWASDQRLRVLDRSANLSGLGARHHDAVSAHALGFIEREVG